MRAFRMVPEELIWRWLRWFHHPATAVMVATETLKRELAAHGFHPDRHRSAGLALVTMAMYTLLPSEPIVPFSTILVIFLTATLLEP